MGQFNACVPPAPSARAHAHCAAYVQIDAHIKKYEQSVGKYSLDVCACSSMSAAGSLQVDVIVSEWMGYALLFEAMLDTVLYARDRSA